MLDSMQMRLHRLTYEMQAVLLLSQVLNENGEKITFDYDDV